MLTDDACCHFYCWVSVGLWNDLTVLLGLHKVVLRRIRLVAVREFSFRARISSK